MGKAVRTDQPDDQEIQKKARQSKRIAKGDKLSQNQSDDENGNDHHNGPSGKTGGFSDTVGKNMPSASSQSLDKIFRNVKELDSDLIDKKAFLQRFHDMGVLADDERIRDIIEKLDCIEGSKFSKDELHDVIQDSLGIVEKTLSEDFIIPQFSKFKRDISKIYVEAKKNNSGNNADYIPELAKANTKHFGVSICTVDGQRINIGNTKIPFSI